MEVRKGRVASIVWAKEKTGWKQALGPVWQAKYAREQVVDVDVVSVAAAYELVFRKGELKE